MEKLHLEVKSEVLDRFPRKKVPPLTKTVFSCNKVGYHEISILRTFLFSEIEVIYISGNQYFNITLGEKAIPDGSEPLIPRLLNFGFFGYF